MTSLTILKENLTWETFLVELSRARKGSTIGNKFGYLCMGAIPFNQNVWFKFSATSLQYRMEQHFRNIYPNFRKLSSGSFLSAFKFAPECLNFWLKGSHFGNVSGSLGTFPGKYCTNCRCFQSFLSFGWMESAQNASKKFWFWENRLHVLRTMCKNVCCTCKLDVSTLALLITSD